MHGLRKFLGWTFAITSLVCLRITVSNIPDIIHRQHYYHHLSLSRTLHTVLVGPMLFGVQAIVFAVAWWTIWRGKRSARGWGIAASLILVVFPLSIFLLVGYLSHTVSISGLMSFLQPSAVVLGIGVVGLIAFWRRFDESTTPATAQQNIHIPRDGTNALVNKAVVFLAIAGSFGAYSWWMSWLRSQGAFSQNSLQRIVIATLVAIAVATLHELGHAVTGFALGMKLRAFLAGPFQWRIRDGKWEFQFDPAGLVSVGGATGVVPRKADLPQWSSICMVAAGPLTTLLTGSVALWIAVGGSISLPMAARGPLALFAAWSLFFCR